MLHEKAKEKKDLTQKFVEEPEVVQTMLQFSTEISFLLSPLVGSRGIPCRTSFPARSCPFKNQR